MLFVVAFPVLVLATTVVARAPTALRFIVILVTGLAVLVASLAVIVASLVVVVVVVSVFVWSLTVHVLHVALLRVLLCGYCDPRRDHRCLPSCRPLLRVRPSSHGYPQPFRLLPASETGWVT